MLRRGREAYSKKYDEAIKLHNEGRSVKEIASTLGVSYSAAYHWVKGLRKPEKGNVNEFYDFLKKNGPMAVHDIEKVFPKHNELYLMTNKRGLKVKRKMLQRKLGTYSTWYYIEGQENIAEERIEELFSKIKEIKDKMRDSLYQ